jgi:site-specific DNA recombinase
MTYMPATTAPAPLPPHVVALVDKLRARDADPGYADKPVLDVYGRISKNPETGDFEKVDRQLEDCLNELLRRKARLGLVLRDDGISAWRKNAKRPDWLRLVARLESKEAHGVIAWHTDRLLRQPRDLERLITFGEAGLLVASCHGDYDLGDSDARFQLRILTAAAAKDSDNTSRRQKRKANAKRDKGQRTGGPRGFGEPGTYRKVKVSDEQVAVEREAIAWAVRGHLDGKVSVRDIARQWNMGYVAEDGTTIPLRTVGGKEWDPRYVSQVLLSPRIAGLIVHDGVTVGRRTDMEPIITEDEHRAIVATFASRKRGRPHSADYLLTGGFLHCGRCGKAMTGRAGVAHGQKVRRYACRKASGTGCGNVMIVSGPLDALVIEDVAEILSRPEYARQVRRSGDALERAKQALALAEETASKLAAKLGSGGMTFAVWEAAHEQLRPRLAALRAEVEGLSTVEAQAVAVAATAEEIRATLTDPDVPIEQRRLLVRAAFPRGLRILPWGKGRNVHGSDIRDRVEVIETAPVEAEAA